MEQETKKCPFCGEEILATAKKCKHCGEWLDGQSHSAAQSMVVTRKNDEYRNKYAESTWKLVILSVISSGVYTLFWIAKQLEYLNNHAKYQEEKITSIFTWYIVLFGLNYYVIVNLWSSGIAYQDTIVWTLLYGIVGIILYWIMEFKLAKLYENYIEKTYDKKIHLNRFLVFLIAPYYINHTANTIEDRLR